VGGILAEQANGQGAYGFVSRHADGGDKTGGGDAGVGGDAHQAATGGAAAAVKFKGG
jgi:hypothetical protein